MNNRVGILGGTFNPVHLGHVDLGNRTWKTLGLEKVLYILSAQPPHKKSPEIVGSKLRWRMLNTALSQYPQLVPCDVEMKRPTWSWTIDTIRQLKEEYREKSFFFISGSEGFLKIQTWKEYKSLLSLISFIVVIRKDEHVERVKQLAKEEGLEPPVDMRHNAVTAPPPGIKTDEKDKTSPGIYLFSYQSDKLFISSTLIRNRVRQGESIDGLVNDEVKEIMEENKLYE